MNRTPAWIAAGLLVAALLLMFLGTGGLGVWRSPSRSAPPRREHEQRRSAVDKPDTAEFPDGPVGDRPPVAEPESAPTRHPLLGTAHEAVVAVGFDKLSATAAADVVKTIESLRGAVDESSQLAALTIDYPQSETIFPPEFISPTFLWHDSDEQVDTWLVTVTVNDAAAHLDVLVPGVPPPSGPVDRSCLAPSNALYVPTPYQASARSWTPSDAVWAAIKQASGSASAQVTIYGFHSSHPTQVRSRGRMTLSTSADPVGAPIFYRDVPLAPALTEKGVIKPLADDAVSLIGWRLRDVSQPDSRLLLTDVPTCTNCHSFSNDGQTLGMDLDGPQGDKGAYVVAPVTPSTRFESRHVMTWNAFRDKPADHKTIGFLSRLSPDGQYAVTTLNEAVYVSNFMDYQFLQVFFPTRGILAYYSQATGEIQALPGADDPQFVHCDAVWTPDGEHLVFARAPAKDPYPADGRLAAKPNDPAETQIQYDLYRIPFQGGRGDRAEPIAGAAGNGMSNTFPKVSPDGRWIVPAAGGTARKMRCNLERMNSWHSFSPNGRWLVFSSKDNTPYTQMFLTHIDPDGNDSPPVLIPNSTAANRAVNLPEFVNRPYQELLSIEVPALDHYRHAFRGLRLAKQQHLDEALAEYEQALQSQPDFWQAQVEAAILLTRQGKFDEAMSRLDRALALNPKDSRAHGIAGTVLAKAGRLDEAVVRFQKALALDPRYRSAHTDLGRIFLDRGQLDQATFHFQEAVQLDGQDSQARLALGQAFLQQHLLGKAQEQFRQAIALDPHELEAYLQLSKTLVRQGDHRAAVALLRKALAVDANNVRPAADLAWLLAVCPQDDVRNGAQAVALARRVCTVTGDRNPVLLHTLAAAYAEVGDFSLAVATASRALQLVGPQDRALADSIRQGLEHYRAGKPLRPLTPAVAVPGKS